MQTIIKPEASEKRTKLYIEFIRMVAIYLVMFNHTGTGGFFLFSVATDSRLYPFYMFISIADKIAVPLYFMISGALLLGKEESIKTIYRKRVLRFLIVLTAISFVYRLYYWYKNGTAFTALEFFKMLYTSNAATALWYMYSYIGFLMMLPLLRKMVKSMEAKEYVYMAVCQITLTGILPIVQFLLSKGTVGLNGSFSAVIFTASNIFYVVMGYYCENVLKEEDFTAKRAIIGLCGSFAAIVIMCLMTYYKAVLTGECSEGTSQTFHGSLIAIPTFTAYYCSKLLFMRVKKLHKFGGFLQFVGGTTFGIYLFEGILRNETLFVFDHLKPYIHTLPACLIWILAAYVCGVLVTAILKKIPIIKNYL